MTFNSTTPDQKILNRKPRVVHNEASWKQLIAQYETGSLTQKSFCQQHRISVSSLHKWRNRFKQDEDSTHFIDISKAIVPTQHTSQSASEQESPAWLVELELGQGMVLRVRSA
jgi:transposase-like protein